MQKRYGANWATEMGCEQTCTEQDLREVFDLVDADGGGTLDREEIAVLADFFTEKPMSEAQIDEAMAEMDDDNSGEVVRRTPQQHTHQPLLVPPPTLRLVCISCLPTGL